MDTNPLRHNESREKNLSRSDNQIKIIDSEFEYTAPL